MRPQRGIQKNRGAPNGLHQHHHQMTNLYRSHGTQTMTHCWWRSFLRENARAPRRRRRQLGCAVLRCTRHKTVCQLACDVGGQDAATNWQSGARKLWISSISHSCTLHRCHCMRERQATEGISLSGHAQHAGFQSCVTIAPAAYNLKWYQPIDRGCTRRRRSENKLALV